LLAEDERGRERKRKDERGRERNKLATHSGHRQHVRNRFWR
jgi:hypothetical protein